MKRGYLNSFLIGLAGSVLGLSTLLTPGAVSAAVIVDDRWADGGRTNGPDPLDASWWSSTSSSGNSIEVTTGFLGLVSGSSGRGIHGTFAPQALTLGDTLEVIFTFRTPASVAGGSSPGSAFKVGLFDSNPGNLSSNSALAADLNSGSGTGTAPPPNPLYNSLPGYMLDFDVNGSPGDINFREKTAFTNTQLLATTSPFTSIGAGGATYTFAGNTDYTGEWLVTKTTTGLEFAASLSSGTTVLTSHVGVIDNSVNANLTKFDLLAFHANSNAFGANTTLGDPNNGIEFSNIRIEVNPIPEPDAFLFGATLASLIGVGAWRSRLESK